MRHVKEWFGEWFDSPYYHILYQHRDENEAKAFIDKLCEHFQFDNTDHILDLACGRGRHAKYLNEKGCRVTGVDLSPKNIDFARQFSNNQLDFEIGDMRDYVRPGKFTHVFNLFTSFGYFENEEDNYKSVESVWHSLKPGGIFLIDFLNIEKAINGLIPEDIKKVDGLEFHINRTISEDGFIEKKIDFQAEDHHYSYIERVKSIGLEGFKAFFYKTGFDLKQIFGDYQLNSFNESSSDRMILVAEKK